MSSNPDKYKGQWVSRNPIKNDGGQPVHKFINVIKYEDGYVRAIGENIPLAEFERTYCRPQEIADPEHDPFKSKDVLKGVSKTDVIVTEPIPEPKVEAVKELTDDQYIEKKLNMDSDSTKTDNPVKSNLSKFNESEKFLLKAIELSNNKSENNLLEVRGMDIDIPLSFNIKKIVQIADTMGIEGDSLVSVLREELTKKESVDPIIDMLLDYIIQLAKNPTPKSV